MVSKCANPQCTDEFRYFRGGKLFRFQFADAPQAPSIKRTKFYWLCQDCAPRYTLRLIGDSNVLVSRLPDGSARMNQSPFGIVTSAA
jgi:hypothetical protein